MVSDHGAVEQAARAKTIGWALRSDDFNLTLVRDVNPVVIYMYDERQINDDMRHVSHEL
jgi:hypothetical protein